MFEGEDPGFAVAVIFIVKLVGCFGIGFISKTLLRGIEYGFLSGLLMFVLSISLVGLGRYGIEELAMGLVFHLVGPVVIVICGYIIGRGS
ncbi:MAG: hypothetical protein HKN28_15855 [Alphaproteobacteria bacterium]|nr:hypothetical protein [Alphaproteobacteria bacterium]